MITLRTPLPTAAGSAPLRARRGARQSTGAGTLPAAALAALAVVALACPGLAENWPGWRGPTGQGISAETGLPTKWSAAENVAWKTPIPGQGWSSPIVWDDRVFVTTATDGGASFRLIALDRKTGAILWNNEIVRQKPDNKSPENSYATPTPVTDGKHVYALAFDGSLAAVSMDGRAAWTNRDVKFYSQHGLAVSPVLCGDLVVVPFDGSSRGPDKRVGWQKPWDESVVVAYDKNTGQVRWRTNRSASRIAHTVPRVVNVEGRDQIISSAGNVVQGFDPAGGERLWTVTNLGEGVVPSPVVGGGLVFVTSGFTSTTPGLGPPAIRAVRLGGKGDCTSTHIAWEQTKGVPMIPSMLYVKPYLYVLHEGGTARCMKAETGEIVGDLRLRGPHTASPVWAEGRIYFLSEKGEATVVEAGPEFKEVARSTIAEKCCASLAVSQQHIFIRSEGNLLCIGR
jgi:hypothetical protein